ncbi:MAG: tRNA epoxyqueuosine(34) reductase QueG [Gammaproteobacteria bacterium]|nr:tRNA epoxyqueuosine(34) reductase QueG [Gammaproteobacteria bacterium]MCW8839523.1 tRNA epoxyqueuosine(34) reductase QueG [Gammaproteobacteria bacterium]MCW8928447.1 tRNA epoxyqueuosine(34) reductase QueG [Gammaproteobacteria bacterium]MCW8959598.1 tRNA epoxyqueuosine(34) reductase QueG [Gammaproteobacteria bacterium]MCW8971840.1 tRNA epoxyqueuosine(34) reductase QueG [Gammaproteobacteria bacterium]
MAKTQNHFDRSALVERIRYWGRDLGFQQVGISDTVLERAEQQLLDWLKAGYHGQMEYMQRHGTKRSRPAELEPGTISVISVRMDYLPPQSAEPWSVLGNGEQAYISRYALGRDYHKLMRKRLQQLADRIGKEVGDFGYRVFVDSAPVLEKPLAAKAGLGWVGKHSNLLHRDSGSWFFLGEIYTDLPLPADQPVAEHCGTCQACIDICPTAAIIEPYVVDARRCISYLTIEHKGSIPESLRPHLGNRIYGCDDCQLVCPWNRFSRTSDEKDYAPRHGLDAATLIELFGWDEETFLKKTEGSAIRRIGHESWLRNIAVAMGNAPRSEELIIALVQRRHHPSEIVREHVGWALLRQQQ